MKHILFNKLSYTLMCIIALVLFNGCSKDKLSDTSVIPEVNNVNNDFDKWLLNNYVKPYNIEFVYRLPDIESDMNYTLVPADYKKSIEMANILKYLCLEPFVQVAPDDFLKKYFPKMILLVGSHAYRNNNTYVLGTAEGGLKITLYGINLLNTTNIEALNNLYFRTIYHEFAHILHQTKDYSTDYKVISATEYVGESWNEAWTKKSSLQAGFISDYSSKEVNEDFVELFAHYITYSDKKWNDTLEKAGGKDGKEFSGKAILEQKTAILKDYMKNTWSIDIDALRAEIAKRTANVKDQNFDILK